MVAPVAAAAVNAAVDVSASSSSGAQQDAPFSKFRVAITGARPSQGPDPLNMSVSYMVSSEPERKSDHIGAHP